MKNTPEFVILDDLRKELSYRGLKVVLAGGACRDHFFNKPVKDYDFFVLGQDWMYILPDYTDLGRQLADEGTFRAVLQQGYSDNLRCGDVWEFQYCGLRVNIIFPCLDGDGQWRNLSAVIDHFDTTLNLIGYDFETSQSLVDKRFAGLTRKVEFVSDPDKVGRDRVQRRFDRLYPRYKELDWDEIIHYLGVEL